MIAPSGDTIGNIPINHIKTSELQEDFVLIEFKNVTKKYDNKTTALSDVNISIDKGEFVFVVGSSGAGKSTFLKLMMREEVPSSGTITIDGVELNKMRKRKIPKFRRKLGIVFQDFRLIPNMTVYDNVAFAMRVIGTKEKKIRRRVPYLLSLMNLSAKARNYPRELSGGEQQRVALARALANDAEIIIADEPTGNVDPQMSYDIVELLMRLNESGTTIIMVTHEHSLVRCFDKRVIVLEKGSVVADGNILDYDAATAHINSAGETANESVALPEEDYSAYAQKHNDSDESATDKKEDDSPSLKVSDDGESLGFADEETEEPGEIAFEDIDSGAKEIAFEDIDSGANEIAFEDISSGKDMSEELDEINLDDVDAIDELISSTQTDGGEQNG